MSVSDEAITLTGMPAKRTRGVPWCFWKPSPFRKSWPAPVTASADQTTGLSARATAAPPRRANRPPAMAARCGERWALRMVDLPVGWLGAAEVVPAVPQIAILAPAVETLPLLARGAFAARRSARGRLRVPTALICGPDS